MNEKGAYSSHKYVTSGSLAYEISVAIGLTSTTRIFMKERNSATTITLIAALVAPLVAYSAAPIEISPINSVMDGASCEYYPSTTDKPKLVKNMFDGGKAGFYEYEHAPGRPHLITGNIGAANEFRLGAVMNLSGQEMLLSQVNQEPSQCMDEVHHKQTQCSTHEYATDDTRVIVKRLTGQSACYPDRESCAGDAASVLVTIMSKSSKRSVVMVGGCRE